MSNPVSQEAKNLVDKISKVEEFVAKNDLSDKATMLKREFGVDQAKDLEKTLLEQEQHDRILRIGILGRVKAGKSSFLNALIFGGEDILPKAATPMTAALTIIEYAEHFGANVDFYTQEDIQSLKAEHGQYLELVEQIKQEKLKELQEKRTQKPSDTKVSKEDTEKQEEKVEKIAHQEAKENERLFASYDQYERIKQSNIQLGELKQYQNIQANNIDDLKEKLKDFVGSDGKLMPFTKSVTLQLKDENLKDLQIIDSPGINDPIASRGERTNELLKECDVVFLISPSGQFLSAEDIDLLDRLTIREGVQEFYVIASQVDHQLFGSCRDEAKGVLDPALKNIEDSLSRHMRQTFENQKKKYSKEYAKTILARLDKLMQHPVICTSAMAFSLMQNWDKQCDWNEELQWIWGNLQEEYLHFFETEQIAKNSLSKIANLQKIKEIISEVRLNKSEIQKNKQQEFLNIKSKGLQDYINELLERLKADQKRLQEGDLDKIRQEKDNIIKTQEKESLVLDNYYTQAVEDLRLGIRKSLNANIRLFFKESDDSVSQSHREESKTRSYEVSTSTWYNPLSWFGTETRYKTITRTVVQAGNIRTSLNDLIEDLTELLGTDSEEMIIEWKKKFPKEMVKDLRKKIGDDFIDVAMLETMTKEVANAIVYPEIDLGGIPSELNKSGTLYDSEAEKFIKSANDFIASFKLKVKSEVKNYLDKLNDELSKVCLSQKVFGQYLNEIQRLESEIQNKQSNLERYEKIIQELEKI